jgi:hypothetical protein
MNSRRLTSAPRAATSYSAAETSTVKRWAWIQNCRIFGSADVRFSNRPAGVKRFQAVQRCSVDVARGLALLFGLGIKALVWGFFSQAV